jgi:hypothetical protein
MDHEPGHTRLPDLRCPYCSARLDCADGLSTNTSATPTSGAVAICIDCAEPSMFVDGPFGMAFRKPTKEERTQIMAKYGPALVAYMMARGSDL